MRAELKTAVLTVALLALATVSFAGPKARKLTADAYLKTAKIEIADLDTNKYAYAQVMLDSLLMNYGPYAEAYYWIAKMQLDKNEKTGDLKKKQPYLKAAMLYIDSVNIVCADSKAKANNRKDCAKFVAYFDTVKTQLWSNYYRDGFKQIGLVKEQMDVLRQETDSTAVAVARDIVAKNTDSCRDNMELAIIVNPRAPLAYIGIASAYEKQDSIDRSNEWLQKGLERATATEDRLPLVQQLAVSNGIAAKYKEAATYFAEWVNLIPRDTGAVETMSNLAICLNGADMYDSALSVQREILKLNPSHAAALTGVARYFTEIAGWAGDSVKARETAKDSAGVKKWINIRSERYDSARGYLKQVFEMYPDSVTVADQYGLICASRGDYANAVIAFERVTRLDPSNTEAWTSLGDCYVYLKRLKDAIGPYEKVIEAQPTNKAILEQLKNLYHEQGNAAKEAEIDVKLKKI